jgi:CRISPR/Cas system endoribonuclease Cas6 (RAMP superfamily)
MRLRISLSPEGPSLRLPVQYNHLLQGLIYSNLDHALSEWLHEKGHPYGERHFKLSPSLVSSANVKPRTDVSGSTDPLTSTSALWMRRY